MRYDKDFALLYDFSKEISQLAQTKGQLVVNLQLPADTIITNQDVPLKDAPVTSESPAGTQKTTKDEPALTSETPADTPQAKARSLLVVKIENGANPAKYYVVFKDEKNYLGGGSFGSVFNAVELDPTTGKEKRIGKAGDSAAVRLAAKLMEYDKEASTEELVEEEEMQAMFDPTSKPTVIYQDAGKEESTFTCVISEYIPGAGVKDDDVAKFDLLQRLTRLQEAAMQMEAMHTGSNRYIHRDIKPANISSDQQAGSLIFDYGLAKKIEDVDYNPTRLHDSEVSGTLEYMAPEILSQGKACLNSDVYSFTAIFLHFLGVTTEEIRHSKSEIASNLRDALKAAETLDPQIRQEKNLWRHRDLKSQMVILHQQITYIRNALAETDFETTNLFKGLNFTSQVFTDQEFKTLIQDIIIPRMQATDPKDRYSSSDVVEITTSLRQLIVLAGQDTERQYATLAKLLLVSNGLWRSHLNNEFNFKEFDFAANPEFCQAVYLLYRDNKLTESNLRALFTTKESFVMARTEHGHHYPKDIEVADKVDPQSCRALIYLDLCDMSTAVCQKYFTTMAGESLLRLFNFKTYLEQNSRELIDHNAEDYRRIFASVTSLTTEHQARKDSLDNVAESLKKANITLDIEQCLAKKSMSAPANNLLADPTYTANNTPIHMQYVRNLFVIAPSDRDSYLNYLYKNDRINLLKAQLYLINHKDDHQFKSDTTNEVLSQMKDVSLKELKSYTATKESEITKGGKSRDSYARFSFGFASTRGEKIDAAKMLLNAYENNESIATQKDYKKLIKALKHGNLSDIAAPFLKAEEESNTKFKK